MREFCRIRQKKMRVSALPELQAYPPSFSPPPKAAMEARDFSRVSLHPRDLRHKDIPEVMKILISGE